MSHAEPERWRPADEKRPAEANNDEVSSAEYEEHARLFYERLEETGELVDVDDGADLAALPPHVTHVRYPDGTVERIGFCASPYGG